MGTERLLAVAIESDLAEALASEGRGPGEAAVLTDAVARLHALLAAGRDLPERVRPAGRLELVETWLPSWVIAQVDSSVGARPGLDDRADVVAAALAAHLSTSRGPLSRLARTGPGAPGAAVDRRGIGEARAAVFMDSKAPESSLRSEVRAPGRPAPLTSAGRAERAQRRLELLVNAGEAMRFKASELFPPADLQSVKPLDPGEVVVGLANAERLELADWGGPRGQRELWTDEANREHQQSGLHLSGLTNRIAPTLWGTSRLAELQLDSGGQPIAYGDYIASLMPDAWRIGEGLEKADRVGWAVKFAPGARWPKLPRRRRETGDDVEMERTAQIAQAVTSFIEYSLISWRPMTRSSAQPARGPMALLGLADIWDDAGEVWVSTTPDALPLLSQLGELGTSCLYPHSGDAWSAYSRFLAAGRGSFERDDLLAFLEILAGADSRATFFEAAAAHAINEQKIERRRGAASKGYSTDASGVIGRLREWGLVSLDAGSFGWSAITQRGCVELEGRGIVPPPGYQPPAI